MTSSDPRADYESIDWTEIQKRFRDGALRSKLMRLAATLTAIAMVLLVVNLIGLFWLRTHVQGLIEHRAPLTDATRQAQLGMQRSLATLRGWVALGDLQFKSARLHIWDDEIMPSIARMDELFQCQPNRRLKSGHTEWATLELLHLHVPGVRGMVGRDSVDHAVDDPFQGGVLIDVLS